MSVVITTKPLFRQPLRDAPYYLHVLLQNFVFHIENLNHTYTWRVTPKHGGGGGGAIKVQI